MRNIILFLFFSNIVFKYFFGRSYAGIRRKKSIGSNGERTGKRVSLEGSDRVT